ncbi:MAG: hypothetical protein R3F61_32870 [Myxococcota bacterium]
MNDPTDGTRRAHPPVGELPSNGEPPPRPLLTLGIDPSYVTEHWSVCGSVADFVALFALHGRSRELVTSASTVINELVENSVKYAAPSESRVEVVAWATGDSLTVETRHVTTPHHASRLRAALSQLRSTRTEEVIEAQAEDGEGSGLGLVSVVREHGAQVGALVAPADDGPNATTGDAHVTHVIVRARMELDAW